MKLTVITTNADTFRVLVDGKVHPLLVGFHDSDEAIEKAVELFPHGEFASLRDHMHYTGPIFMIPGDDVDVRYTLRRFLPSEAEMTDLLTLVTTETYKSSEDLKYGQMRDAFHRKIPGRFYIEFKGARFEFNDYDLQSLPIQVVDAFFP